MTPSSLWIGYRPHLPGWAGIGDEGVLSALRKKLPSRRKGRESVPKGAYFVWVGGRGKKRKKRRKGEAGRNPFGGKSRTFYFGGNHRERKKS